MSSLYQKFNDLSKGKLAQQVGSTPGGALSRGSQSGAIQNSSKAALRTQASSGGAISAAQRDPLSKPLLHILDYGEKPGDLAISSRYTGLNGQTDVYITRAEMELKKAMQSLAFMTNSEINSVTTMTAMSLPKAVTPLFWTIRALLQEKYQKPNDRNRIHPIGESKRRSPHVLGCMVSQPYASKK